MFILDDILLSPFKMVHWLAKEIDRATQEEIENEAQQITERLRDLYRMLEAGDISEAEFDAQENELLDRLDAIEAQRNE